MGIEGSTLGKSYRKALAVENRAGREHLDSNLEAAFVCYLKELRVPKWLLHKPIPPLGTGSEADFLWLDVVPRRERYISRHLAIFIDGQVHGLKGRYAQTMRVVNLCTLLNPEWMPFRFADSDLEKGAQVVSLWHAGEMNSMLIRLKETK